VPLLFQTGYLTIKGIEDFTKNYILGFPNNEVKNGFYNSLVTYFTTRNKKIKGISEARLIKELMQENLEDFFADLKAFYAAVPSTLYSKKESHYHTMFYALLPNYTKMEESVSSGRIDAVIELPKQVYIFEFKAAKGKTAKTALKQIVDKDYAAKYNKPTETRKIYCVGVLFNSKTHTVQDYVVNE
jgi:ATP-dependent exoDNAse (exonuclease V) beta subunit